MFASVILDYGGNLLRSSAEPTDAEYVIDRKADNQTMDDYIMQLLSQQWGSRYAGRIWTDKSVFAYDGAKSAADNKIVLDMATDGYTGEVKFSADFAHVFSALASSQVVHEWPPSPIDMVLVLDISSSMGNATDPDPSSPFGQARAALVEYFKGEGSSTIDNDDFKKYYSDKHYTRYDIADSKGNDYLQVFFYSDALEKSFLAGETIVVADHPGEIEIKPDGNTAASAVPDRITLNENGTTAKQREDRTGEFWGKTLEEVAAARALPYTRYSNLVYSADRVITALMKNNPENRVAVVVYDRRASVVMPLAHYTPNEVPISQMDGNSNAYYDYHYLDGHPGKTPENADAVTRIVSGYVKDLVFGYLCPYIDGHGMKPAENHPTNYVDLSTKIQVVCSAEEGVTTRNVADSSSNGVVRISGTNTHAGLTAGFEQLADAKETTFSAQLTSGRTVTVPRIPAAIVMTDGGSNTVANGPWYDPDWADPVQRNDNKTSWSSVVDTQYLLTAAYLKSAVEKNYSAYMEVNEGEQDFPVYTVGVDLRDDSDAWVPARLYPMLDPANFFKEAAALPDYAGNPSTLTGDVALDKTTKNHIGEAYKDWLEWASGDTAQPTEDFEVVHWSSTNRVPTHHFQQEDENNQYPIPFEQDVGEDGKEANSKNWNPDYTGNKETSYAADSSGTRFNLTWHGWTSETLNDKGAGDPQVWSDYGVNSDATAIWGRATYWSFANALAAANASGGADTAAGYMLDRNVQYTDDVSKLTQTRPVAAVTQSDIISNINYVTEFYNVTSSQMESIFEQILTAVIGQVFVPIAGENESGVSNSITYQDPLGEYMEIKNESIKATPYHVDDPTVADKGEQTYDMAMLVFGEMHGLVRAGVYDWNWNDTWMFLNEAEAQGIKAFPMGWYKGEPKKGQSALPNDKIKVDSDGSSTYPACDYPDNPDKTYTSAQDARDDGWVFRFDFATMLQFVPLNENVDPSTHPSDLSPQIKNTVYTCYRFAGSQTDRNELRRNPIFEEGVPADLTANWDKYYEEHNHKYPDTDEMYRDVPGVYRLSDIRVWVEEYGDFKDSEGAITPNQGYDRSLYMNIPAGAVPTQLATITLDVDGVQSYKTNLATDKGLAEGSEEYKAFSRQSTPLRLFYSVGLEEAVLIRDEDGNQIGVDVNKLSAEYVTDHTVAENNRIWFISNYYSGTTYDNYVTDTASYRTRGDPTMTFSPSIENRYYVFQKPLPLYAHAYKQVNPENSNQLAAVDIKDGFWRQWDTPGQAGGNWNWSPAHPNGGGNGSTTWENGTTGGTWVGTNFMGTYKDGASFGIAKEEMQKNGPDEFGNSYITDDHGSTYLYTDDGIVFFEDDVMDKVTTKKDGSGYEEDSNSFNSEDYYFILIEYYVPDGTVGSGVDEKGNPVQYSYGGHMVQHVVARRGSEFGSGYVSDKINNGDMLCWSDMTGQFDTQFEYLSYSETGDRTRGEPTFEKLTYTEETQLRNYLENECGIKPDVTMDNPNYNADTDPEDAKTISVLDWQVQYWLGIQQNPQVAAALETARMLADEAGTEFNASVFNERFKFAVSARPGGIRSGDMSNNRHAKGENITGTAGNYYVPTISDNSGIGNGVIINNYMGNNGYLEIGNETLHVTKTVEAPEGFELIEGYEDEEFNYQVYVEGLTGTRSAVRTTYNIYGKVWERELAYIDVLTDNGDLALDNNSNRALFISAEIGAGLMGKVQSAKMIVANGTYEDDGSPIYYIANEDGTVPLDATGSPDSTKIVDKGTQLYYLYLPPINLNKESGLAPESETPTQHVRRLYQNKKYDGTAEGYPGTYEDDSENYDAIFRPNGITTFVDEEHSADVTGTEPGADNRDSRRMETADRPAGTKTYWAQNAELIPIEEVMEAEAADSALGTEQPGGIALMAIQATTGATWTHGDTCDGHIHLKYYNLFIRRPSEESSKTDYVSPLSTRTMYLTQEMNFGYNSNENDGGASAPGEALSVDDLYDQTIPSDTNLFDRTSLQRIARNTAEFTLKHNEGLLITGLSDNSVYRFTEKLTAEQIAKGYKLKQISQIEQEGEEKIYEPGEQKGVYTAYGDTGLFEEQVSYINTVEPEMLVITKQLVDESGNLIEAPLNVEFTFTLTITDESGAIIKDADGTLYLWRGNKEGMTSALTWTDASGAVHKMPSTAPQLDAFEDYILPETGADENAGYLQPLELVEDTENTYTVTLRGGEAVVIYGLAAGMKYTVTETKADGYPAVSKAAPHLDADAAENYVQEGTVTHNPDDNIAFTPSLTANRNDFFNQITTSFITVEKVIGDDDCWEVSTEFTFTVTLTDDGRELLDSTSLTVVKYKKAKDGTETSEEISGVTWTPGKDAEKTTYTAEFTLKHGERIVISGVPYDTVYKVAESGTNGYNLQHVAGNSADEPDEYGLYLTLDRRDNSVTGTVTKDGAEAYLLFNNTKPPELPFTGSFGLLAFYAIGAVALSASVTGFVVYRRKQQDI